MVVSAECGACPARAGLHMQLIVRLFPQQNNLFLGGLPLMATRVFQYKLNRTQYCINLLTASSVYDHCGISCFLRPLR